MSKVRGVLHMLQRKFKIHWDMERIQNVIYNESAGAQKNINVEPVIKRAYVANEQVPFGSYIKVTSAGTYSQICTGKDHSDSVDYKIGDVVVESGNVYVCKKSHQGKTFDSSDWTLVAPASITGIPVQAGQTVCVGKYHNSINVAGHLVDDATTFKRVE